MLQFKLLRPEDVTREILDILDILTETKYLLVAHAKAIIAHQLRHNIYTWVGFLDDKPVCMGSLVILSKIGRNGSRAALIEDVAVKPEFQHCGYGQSLIEFLKEKATTYNVYKITLNCSEKNRPFYEKCGFESKGYLMRIDHEQEI